MPGARKSGAWAFGFGNRFRFRNSTPRNETNEIHEVLLAPVICMACPFAPLLCSGCESGSRHRAGVRAATWYGANSARNALAGRTGAAHELETRGEEFSSRGPADPARFCRQ